MKQTITETQFIEAFDIMGREDNFTHNGRRALFAHPVSYTHLTLPTILLV